MLFLNEIVKCKSWNDKSTAQAHWSLRMRICNLNFVWFCASAMQMLHVINKRQKIAEDAKLINPANRRDRCMSSEVIFRIYSIPI